MEELAGKVAVVTGAASGIGRALVDRFLADGMKVVLADVEQGPLDAAVEELTAAGADVIGVRTDVSRYDAVEALRDATLDAFGAVHVVCNNAGVGSGGTSWEVDLDVWDWVLGVDLYGVIHGVKAFMPLLVEQGEGHMVNTASMAGTISAAFLGPYNVAKHGVVTLSETMFAELQMLESPVGVSVLCPGWVKTQIHQSDRNRPEPSGSGLDHEPAEESPEEAELRQLMSDTIEGYISGGIDPAHVAQLVHDAITAKSFYIFTHPDWMPIAQERMEHLVAGLDPVVGLLPQ
jgi:NAD(P)-dependent dehydrogenase (short-subunit alcohol dehydrogenase family)